MVTPIHIESNWKGGVNLTLAGPTAIIGKNGTGKSRITEPLMLAMTGSIDGIAGRNDVKDSKILWRACPADDDVLYVEVTVGEGESSAVIRWELKGPSKRASWTVNGAKIKKGTANTVLAMRDLRDKLFASADKAEQWMSSTLGFSKEKIVKTATGKIRSKAVKEAARALINASAIAHETPEGVLVALEKRKKEVAAQIKSRDAVQAEMKEITGPIVTDAQLDAAKANVDTARETFDLEESYDAMGRELAVLGVTCQQLTAQKLELTTQLTAGVEALSMPVLTMISNILTAVDSWSAAFPGSKACPCCGTLAGYDAIMHHRGLLSDAYEANQAQLLLAQVDQKLAETGARANELLAQLPPDVSALVVEQIHARYLAAETAFENATTELSSLQQQRISAQSPAVVAELTEKDKEQLKVLTAAITGMKNAIKAAVDDALEALVKMANVYAPEKFGGVKIQFRPTVSVGFERNGKIGLPSGGEETCALMALCAAILDREDAEAVAAGLESAARPITVLIGEDHAIDSDTAGALLSKFNAITSAHVVLPLIAPPDDASTLEGWNVIYTEQLDAAPDPPAVADPPAATTPPPATQAVKEAINKLDGQAKDAANA